eukprot:4122385-Prymnesium_polylepis.1
MPLRLRGRHSHLRADGDEREEERDISVDEEEHEELPVVEADGVNDLRGGGKGSSVPKVFNGQVPGGLIGCTARHADLICSLIRSAVRGGNQAVGWRE